MWLSKSSGYIPSKILRRPRRYARRFWSPLSIAGDYCSLLLQVINLSAIGRLLALSQVNTLPRSYKFRLIHDRSRGSNPVAGIGRLLTLRHAIGDGVTALVLGSVVAWADFLSPTRRSGVVRLAGWVSLEWGRSRPGCKSCLENRSRECTPGTSARIWRFEPTEKIIDGREYLGEGERK
jgi:hypothetical protein